MILSPGRTVTQESEKLSSKRPLNVFSHVFMHKTGEIPESYHNQAYRCGPAYLIHDVSGCTAHDHDHYELAFVIGGHAIHHTSLYRVPLKRGDVLVVAPGQVHAVEEIDGLHITNCAYLTEWLVHDTNELWREEGVLPLFFGVGGDDASLSVTWVPQHPMQEDDFQECLHELRGISRELVRDNPSHCYLRRCLEKLMIKVGRTFAQAESLHYGNTLPREIHYALEQIERQAATDTPFHVRNLANAVGLSSNYFSRVFKMTTGISPRAYYQRRRIEHACWLLLNTDNLITEIAYTLGYLDAPHFARMFHALRGVSPRLYRQRYRDA